MVKIARKDRMHSLILNNENQTLKVEVVPEHGGMVSQIWLNEKEILHIDRVTLETAPMASGGIPILFPFSSRTKDDCYVLDGKTYFMPMHGLVKNDCFAVENIATDRIVLWLENSPSWKVQNYPFDFKLEVEYRLKGDCLTTFFRITNQSEKPMPHYLGWHPFFKSTDKQRIKLKQDMQVHYDYNLHIDQEMCSLDDLSKDWDDVFHSPIKGGFCLDNVADHYQVQCETGNGFDVLVVCSWVPESMCIEPWCGLPDSINTGKLLKWIGPKETKEYTVNLKIQEKENF